MLDIRLHPHSHRFCNGWARRDFLRVGALAPLGLALPTLLAAEKTAGGEKKARAKSVVLVYLGGGLSHHDSFDLKPDAPSEILILVILKASQAGHVGLIAIALTLVLIHLAGIPFSGASVNPARTFGPALVGGQWHAIWIYFAGPAIGAVVAWLVSTLVLEGKMPKAPSLA